MEQLLEDYKRKLKTVIEMLNADTITPETIQRLTVKKGMIASFIVDIERAMADVNTGDSGLHLQRVSGSFCLLADGKPKEACKVDIITTRGRVITGRYEALLGNDIWETDINNHELNESVLAWRVNYR